VDNEFKDVIDVTPSLSFEPMEEEVSLTKAAEEKKEPEVIDDSNLTEEEKKMVDQFVEKIDISNTNSILQYGVGAQKKIADFS